MMISLISVIIKGNMEYFNMSITDLRVLTDIKERTLKVIIDGSVQPDSETVIKLEKAFKLHKGDLTPYLGAQTKAVK